MRATGTTCSESDSLWRFVPELAAPLALATAIDAGGVAGGAFVLPVAGDGEEAITPKTGTGLGEEAPEGGGRTKVVPGGAPITGPPTTGIDADDELAVKVDKEGADDDEVHSISRTMAAEDGEMGGRAGGALTGNRFTCAGAGSFCAASGSWSAGG